MCSFPQGLEMDCVGRVVGGPKFGSRPSVDTNEQFDVGNVRGKVGQITRLIGKGVKKTGKRVFQKVLYVVLKCQDTASTRESLCLVDGCRFPSWGPRDLKHRSPVTSCFQDLGLVHGGKFD